jgi:hypothetical protein
VREMKGKGKVFTENAHRRSEKTGPRGEMRKQTNTKRKRAKVNKKRVSEKAEENLRRESERRACTRAIGRHANGGRRGEREERGERRRGRGGHGGEERKMRNVDGHPK